MCFNIVESRSKSMNCKYRTSPEKKQYHPGGTAFRIETWEPQDRCYLKPMRKDIDTGRWILSGGSPIDVLYPCGPCPLKVPAEYGIMNNKKSGPCPFCRTLNRRTGFGVVTCKKCHAEYELVDA